MIILLLFLAAKTSLFLSAYMDEGLLGRHDTYTDSNLTFLGECLYLMYTRTLLPALPPKWGGLLQLHKLAELIELCLHGVT